MKGLKKEECIPIILYAAKLYQREFENKNFLIIYKNHPAGYGCIETVAYPASFCHLTGVVSKKGPKALYEKAINGALSVNDFDLSPNGSSSEKLSVMDKAMQFIRGNKLIIGDYSPAGRGLLFTDKIAGDKNYAIGFTQAKENDGAYYVPNTLLCGNARSFVKKPLPVLAVFVKNVEDIQYSEPSYQSETTLNTGLNMLPLPKNIKQKISSYLTKLSVQKYVGRTEDVLNEKEALSRTNKNIISEKCSSK